jgi:hypothetical protein
MFVKRVNRFHAITELTGLMSKEIQQIDLCLLNVELRNEAQGLSVKGIIGRQIRYYEDDGRLRRLTDQIQFVICMGKAVAGSLSSLQTELIQEYFILQPGEKGKNNAILDQGFLIIVRNMEIKGILPNINILRVNSVITRGQDSMIIKIPSHSFQPKTFRGKARFVDYTHLPVIITEINGTVCERAPGNLLRETEINETVALLVKTPTPKEEQNFFIHGLVKEAAWLSSPGRYHNEFLVLRLDYQWYLTEPKELRFNDYCSEVNQPVEQIQTLVRLDSRSFVFLRDLQILLPESAEEIQVDLEHTRFENIMTRKGLMVNVTLTWGLIYINLNGLEQYQELQSQFDELLPYYFSEHQKPDYTWTTNLQVKPKRHTIIDNKLGITIECECRINTYQKKITPIIEDRTSTEFIYAKIPLGKIKFSMLEDERYDLKYLPLQIVKVISKLLDVCAETGKGGFIINGHLEINIIYIDKKHVLREDHFQSSFQEFYIWDKLSDQTQVEIDSYGNLNYQSYIMNDAGIFYHYLVDVFIEAFYKKVIPIRIPSEPAVGAGNDSAFPNVGLDHSIIENLIIEGEIALGQGNAKEIASNRVLLTKFNCRNSYNAILVSGSMSGELEYWDQNKYLQKVTVNLPFWRFIHQDLIPCSPECFKLIPRLKNCSFIPSHTKPWRKGSVKARFEVELCQSKEDRGI